MKSSTLFVVVCLSVASAVAQDRCPDPNPLVTGRSYNQTAASEFGQPRLTPLASHNPNYVEGKEFFGPSAVAVENSSNPHRVYVADSNNNRVLAWANQNSFSKGDMADLVIGQRDLFSTDPQGPSTDFASGLWVPVALAVDSRGNLYVADGGNNRILRYPSPFARPDYATPDLIIGQKTLRSGNTANEGLATPTEQTLSFHSGDAIYVSGLAVDRDGNLWVSDPVNNRVLRYPASALTPNTTEPAADLVIGQTSFKTATVSNDLRAIRTNRSVLAQPAGLAISEAGDLYVADAGGRVLYYKAPLTDFRLNADRILGVPTPMQTGPLPNAFFGCPQGGNKDNCDVALSADLGGHLTPPQGLAVFNNFLYVADPGNNRVAKYDNPNNWLQPICNFDGTTPCAAGTRISPTPIAYIGQGNIGTSVGENRGQRQPDSTTLASPGGLGFSDNGDLYVADTGNNRVLVYPSSNGYTSANRVLGQVDFAFRAPNLADGRGLYLVGTLAAAGMAVDKTSNPPRLYVSDTFNNRVLGFADARKVRPGTPADIIIGQPNELSTLRNYGTGDAAAPSATSLASPIGLVVDANGNLFVADAGNSRVLRFPQPFNQPGTIQADLVLGQSNFTVNPANAPALSEFSMANGNPFGLALTQNGSLLVSDIAANRVLLFNKCLPASNPCPGNSDFINGQPAAAVFGQPSFTAAASGSDTTQMNSPHGIATDSSDRLYVADTQNQRIMVFGGVFNAGRNPRASFTQNVSTPFGIAVSQSTGEIWAATAGGTARYPVFEFWSLNPTQNLQVIPRSDANSFPIGIALDAFDNPIIAESNNRLALYYTRATFAQAASFLSASARPLAPGMIAYACGAGINIPTTATLTLVPGLPWPTQWADTQITFNGTPAPIYYVNPDRIAFQVPVNTPTGTADVQVVRISTGQIVAAATIPIDVADPGFFVQDADAAKQQTRPTDPHLIAAVNNDDGKVNSQANPVGRGKYVLLYGTGLGFVPGAPADGRAAAVLAPQAPLMSMNPGGRVPPENIQAALVDWAPGVFQINVKIPDAVPPGQVQVAFSYQGKTSNQSETGGLLNTVIWVK